MPLASKSFNQSWAVGVLGNARGSGGKVCWSSRSHGSDAVSGPTRLLNGDFKYFRNSSVRSMICPSASITLADAMVYLDPLKIELTLLHPPCVLPIEGRSEERRVGKECRSRW